MTTLLLRCDASSNVGLGHVMRCFALAQSWRDRGGAVVIATLSSLDALKPRLESEAIRVERLDADAQGSAADATETVRVARAHGAERTVLDGYSFRLAHQHALRAAGARVMVTDDNAEVGEYACDLLLNQNLHANAALYAGRGHVGTMLLGPRYALLRREFRARAVPARTGAEVRRVLVTLGGGDHDNVTARVLEGLEGLARPIEVAVVVGSANQHGDMLDQLAASARHARVVIHRNVADMGALMADADIAIAGAGSTSWELCYMALPALTIVAAENQRHIAEALDARGASQLLGWHTDVSADLVTRAIDALAAAPDRLLAMGQRARTLVDGQGATRTAALLATAAAASA